MAPSPGSGGSEVSAFAVMVFLWNPAARGAERHYLSTTVTRSRHRWGGGVTLVYPAPRLPTLRGADVNPLLFLTPYELQIVSLA